MTPERDFLWNTFFHITGQPHSKRQGKRKHLININDSIKLQFNHVITTDGIVASVMFLNTNRKEEDEKEECSNDEKPTKRRKKKCSSKSKKKQKRKQNSSQVDQNIRDLNPDKVVGVDPGKHSILYFADKDGNKMDGI